MPQSDQQVRVSQDEARAGESTGVMRWVLLASLLLAIVAMTVIWVTGALSQDESESQGTATARAEAQTDPDAYTMPSGD